MTGKTDAWRLCEALGLRDDERTVRSVDLQIRADGSITMLTTHLVKDLNGKIQLVQDALGGSELKLADKKFRIGGQVTEYATKDEDRAALLSMQENMAKLTDKILGMERLLREIQAKQAKFNKLVNKP